MEKNVKQELFKKVVRITEISRIVTDNNNPDALRFNNVPRKHLEKLKEVKQQLNESFDEFIKLHEKKHNNKEK